MVQQVRAQFNGQWVILSYDPATDTWQGEFTPQTTSFHQAGGYFNIAVEATNDHGTSTTVDGHKLDGLRLIVNEKIPPALTLVTPSEGYVTTKTPTITLTAVDESGGSGVDIDSLSIKVDGETVHGADFTAIEDGYSITYTPAVGLDDGKHSVTIRIADYDGNVAILPLIYIIDTTPPLLALREPNQRSVVDTPTLWVTGVAGDDTASPVTVSIEINGVAFTQFHIADREGEFRAEVPIQIGANHITVTAEDSVGWKTTRKLFVIRLITDRTQADVDALRTLLAKPEKTWTANEVSMFLTAQYRGSYDYTDFNRVTLAVNHLAEKFKEYGYDTTLSPVEPEPGRTEWQKEDFPTPGLTALYLRNVAQLRAVMNIPVPLPDSLEGFGFEEANNIERVLVALDAYSPYMNNAFYAGEIYSGEV